MIQLTDKLAVVADKECYAVGVPLEPVKESGGKRSKAPKLRSPSITLPWHRRCVAQFLPRLDRR